MAGGSAGRVTGGVAAGALLVALATATLAMGDAAATAGPAAAATLATGATAGSAAGPGDESGVRLRRIATADQPVYTAIPPGPAGRRLAFVAERRGTIRVLRRGKLLRRPFADLRRKVRSSGSEEGLLSIAFDPGYAQNRRLYAYFTDRRGDVRVVMLLRSVGSPVRVARGAPRNVIRVPHQLHQFHNGAQVAFGPDGNMWLGPGDGGSPCDWDEAAQSPTSLLGKLLRITPRARGGYTVPADNPFVGRPGRDEIYSLGLRNPYRFSFDRRTGTIAIGDVGQAEREEVDYVRIAAARGANFGWDALEGSRPLVLRPSCAGDVPTAVPPAAVPPIHEYRHTDGPPATCAITGGLVVRDRRLPKLDGRYLYADFCRGQLRSLVPKLDGGRDDRPVGVRVPNPTAITEGRGHRVYVTSMAGGIYRLAAPDATEVDSGAPDARRRAQRRAGDGRGGFRAKRLAGFEEPVHISGPAGAGGLLFVVEQRGVIKLLNKRGKRAGTFLDIRGRVQAGGERGLLSVAFSPRYRRNGRFYVYFTDRHGDIVVQELRRAGKNDRRARVRSARTVIRIRHRENANHNGGQLQFGPDGYLYLGTGDGGSGGDPPENAQNRNRLLGKLIRIDPRRKGKRPYTVPRGNPFVGKSGRDEIYSLGLRNPFRFSFDRRTGRLLIGDVGQSAWEEVDYETLKGARGANFGWDAFEGRERYASADASPPPKRHSPPIFQYSHGNGNCSITGGYVSRDRRIRSLWGRYLYADFCRGQIRSLIPGRKGARRDRPTGLPNQSGISSFGEDARGHLYFVNRNTGGVYAIKPKRR